MMADPDQNIVPVMLLQGVHTVFQKYGEVRL